MKKINVLKVVKIASLAASVLGMIGSSWVNGEENKRTLQKMVDEHLKK